jgi:branched-chain amino acid transport system ATP-binding protein
MSIWGMITNTLELIGVYAGYGQGDVLVDLSLEIRAGEAVCLLGRNGAGKSTTLKAIMQLVRPTQGQVRLNGRDVVGTPTHKVMLGGVGYVPEERRMFPKLTVEENLRVTRTGGGPNGWTLNRVYELFPNLQESWRQMAGTLSGGQQQMLAIARTLMGNPLVLLLDEPSEGLAPLIVRELVTQIARLRDQQLTILLSEQNLRFAEALCDRVYIIDKGAIQFSGTFDTLRNDVDLRQRYLAVGAQGS